jgi:hypothetical protein
MGGGTQRCRATSLALLARVLHETGEHSDISKSLRVGNTEPAATGGRG